MKLTEEQIKSITVGALSITREDGVYRFFKCTESQLRFFDKADEGLGRRARTTTGVRLDFHTSSPYLAFEAVGGGKYEVFVDGMLSDQFCVTDTDRCRCELRAPLGDEKEEYRVTLLLPSHGIGVLSYVELADGATLTPHVFDERLLFIGDSITQGWDTHIDGLSFAYGLSFFFNAESVIQGTGGAYFHEGAFDRLPFTPDRVFVALGTNDFGHYATKEEMAAHADAHLALIAKEYAGKPLYYISPIYRASQEKPMGSFAEAREALIALAEKHGFTHIDGLTLVPPHAFFYTSDLLHPNALGYTQYTENLLRFLTK